MAAGPSFELEDQTDEDFFDKLISDDDDIVFDVKSSSSVAKLIDGSDSGDAKTFGNLSIKDDDSGDDGKAFGDFSLGQVSSVDGARAVAKEENSGPLESLTLVDSENVTESKNVKLGTESVLGLTEVSSNSSSSLTGLINSDTRTAVVHGLTEVSGDTTTSSDVGGFNIGNAGIELVSNLNGVGGSVVSSHVGGLDDDSLETMVVDDLTGSKNSVSRAADIKEVQWTAFSSDTLNDDLFGDLGDAANTGDVVNSASSNIVWDGDMHKAACHDNAHNDSLHQDGQFNGVESENIANEQDLNNSQYWENLYPGWKYDHNTGQWVQVDGYDATTNVQENNNPAVHENSEVSYLQQSAQSAVAALPESGTAENIAKWNQQDSNESFTNWNQKASEVGDTSVASVSNWNQISQVNNGYPAHMIFDPQYPGWYYDSISQEWKSLEAYISSTTSNIQAESHLGLNGYHQIDATTKDVAGNDNFGGTFSNYNHQTSNSWQPDTVVSSFGSSEYNDSRKLGNHAGPIFSVTNNLSLENTYNHKEAVSNNVKSKQDRSQGFVPHQFNQLGFEQNARSYTSNEYYGTQTEISYSQQQQQQQQRGHQLSYAPDAGRSSAGRPPHALVAFGFGGKLIMMKDNNTFQYSPYAQDPVGASISVVNIMEVVNESIDAMSTRAGIFDYFHSLCVQKFPGPLSGGSVANKELNKWTDESIAYCESSDKVYSNRRDVKLLLSLLKIACQHYGKLRSTFGSDINSKVDGPDIAIARLFASAKRNNSQINNYGAPLHCLQKFPSEEHLRATAAEVQTLLVSGRKQDALHCAQENQLWGPALILAAQLGDQYYADTVKQLALRQLVSGSPLQTLCLLIAGQPAELFAAETAAGGAISSATNMSKQSAHSGSNAMLDSWEENLAVITANRTKNDELVLIHLGDSLWKERHEIIAAHISYLIAEASFEPYSDSARLCLVGADHLKFPRTYVSPDAIQRTEIYEYAKLLGNSQFLLLPFQPYKIVYAHMLAEVGRVSDSLKYCQAVLKLVKTGGAPEVEAWRQLASSLEEQIKIHQQGGFSTNIVPAKLVGKLFNLFDSTAHRVVGDLPPPASSTFVDSFQSKEHYSQSSPGVSTIKEHYSQSSPGVSTIQSTMSRRSALVPSTSMEPISEWNADDNKTVRNRSVSEPVIGKNPTQDSKDANTSNSQDKASVSGGTSRFGRFGFGSQLLQKILKPRQDKQAKLGEANKFYYDEKLKRWVEEGVDPPPEEAVLPPPPTATFPAGTSSSILNSAVTTEGALSNGRPEYQSPTSVGHSAGTPPVPPTSNQFSAHARMGARSRYVDTFNKGGRNPTNLSQSQSALSNKPINSASPKFFVPTPVSSVEQVDADNIPQATSGTENTFMSSLHDSSQSVASPSHNLQKFPSMNNIPNNETPVADIGDNSHLSDSKKAASWSGITGESLRPPSRTGTKHVGEISIMQPSFFLPDGPTSVSGGSNGEDLHEVEH